MSLMTCASGESIWRGYNYYLEHRASITRQLSASQYDGTVSGSNGSQYDVHIDLEHARKSACSCPHAHGRRIICKHMISLFFTAFPSEARKYQEELEAYARLVEQMEQDDEMKLHAFVCGLSKSELEELLLDLLYTGPEWQWDRFIQDHIE